MEFPDPDNTEDQTPDNPDERQDRDPKNGDGDPTKEETNKHKGSGTICYCFDCFSPILPLGVETHHVGQNNPPASEGDAELDEQGCDAENDEAPHERHDEQEDERGETFGN